MRLLNTYKAKKVPKKRKISVSLAPFLIGKNVDNVITEIHIFLASFILKKGSPIYYPKSLEELIRKLQRLIIGRIE